MRSLTGIHAHHYTHSSYALLVFWGGSVQATTSPTTLAEAAFPPLFPDRYLTLRGLHIPLSLVGDALLVVGFAFFTALFAQIVIRIPETPVPITGQTFAVLLTGASLGSVRGASSMTVYMLLGMFLPVFAPGEALAEGEVLHFILPWAGTESFVWQLSSGGYIVGFILGAYLVGLLAERGWDRRVTVPLAMLAGNVAIYVIGLPWLAYFTQSGDFIPSDQTLRWGLYPFIGGDAVKMLLAALLLPGAWWLVGKIRGKRPREG